MEVKLMVLPASHQSRPVKSNQCWISSCSSVFTSRAPIFSGRLVAVVLVPSCTLKVDAAQHQLRGFRLESAQFLLRR